AAHHDVDRIGPGAAIAPLGGDDALGRTLDHSRQALAFAPVDRDAASLGDESRNPVRRRRLAAAREHGEQAIDTHDENAAARLSDTAAVQPYFRRGLLLRLAAQRNLQLPRAGRLAPRCSRRAVGPLEAAPPGPLLETRRAHPLAPDLPVARPTPGGRSGARGGARRVSRS